MVVANVHSGIHLNCQSRLEKIPMEPSSKKPNVYYMASCIYFSFCPLLHSCCGIFQSFLQHRKLAFSLLYKPADQVRRLRRHKQAMLFLRRGANFGVVLPLEKCMTQQKMERSSSKVLVLDSKKQAVQKQGGHKNNSPTKQTCTTTANPNLISFWEVLLRRTTRGTLNLT